MNSFIKYTIALVIGFIFGLLTLQDTVLTQQQRIDILATAVIICAIGIGLALMKKRLKMKYWWVDLSCVAISGMLLAIFAMSFF